MEGGLFYHSHHDGGVAAVRRVGVSVKNVVLEPGKGMLVLEFRDWKFESGKLKSESMKRRRGVSPQIRGVGRKS